MYKFYSAVLLMLTLSSAFAFDNLESVFRTKEVVRTKLWYDGVNLNNEKSISYDLNTSPKNLPEELAIPLEMLTARFE